MAIKKRTHKSSKVNGTKSGANVFIGSRKDVSVQVRFGAVTIAAGKQSREDIQRNIEQGQMALERAALKLAKPGVPIRAGKDVPLYHVDEEQPSKMFRTLNGKTESGFIENGRFKAVNE